MTDKPKADYYTGPQAGDFAAAAEPFALFEAWFEDARAHEPNDPNAMALATVDAAGLPNVRMTLLKGVDPAEAATRVANLTQHIETSFALTARLQQLSLLNYLT